MLKSNILIVGDEYQGKTTLLKSYVQKKTVQFSNELPEFFAPHPQMKTIENRTVQVKMYDTEHYLALSRAPIHCILVCISVTDREALMNARLHHIPDMEEKFPHSPILVVSTKSDLLGNHNMQMAMKNRGVDFNRPEDYESLVTTFSNVNAYVQLSAIREQEEVDALFTRAVKLGLSLSELGGFFDLPFRKSELVGVVYKNKHYPAEITETGDKFVKVQYLDNPFTFSNTEKITRRSRVKEWNAKSWLPLVLEDSTAPELPFEVCQLLAEFAGERKCDFMDTDADELSTTLELTHFQQALIKKALKVVAA